MKKIFALFFALIVLAGCGKDTEPTPASEPIGGVISMRSENAMENEPEAKAESRMADDQRVFYTFEAWTRDATPRCVLHKTATGTLAEASIEIMLVPGNYDFLFWADYGTGAYTTDDLRQVTATTVYSPAAISERDAFACAQTGVTWNGGRGMSATLMRPIAKLTMQNKTAFTTGGKTVSVTYRNAPTQYDVLTGMSSVPADITLTFPTTTAGSAAVGEDFLFVSSDAGRPVGIAITVGDVRKELDALPMRPNYKTRVTAVFE